MANVIVKDEGTIGFYSDLWKETQELIKGALEISDWETIAQLAYVGLDLDDWTDDDGLLIIRGDESTGYIVEKYEEERE